MLKTVAVLGLLMAASAAMGAPLSDSDRQTALAAMSRAGDDGLDPARYPLNPQDAASVRDELVSYT